MWRDILQTKDETMNFSEMPPGLEGLPAGLDETQWLNSLSLGWGPYAMRQQ
jgi:hypothetical protein